MKAKPLPSLEYLNQCFELSEDSRSYLLWRNRPKNHFPTFAGWTSFNRQFAGKSAGSVQCHQKTENYYFRVNISGELYLAQRIVYSIHHNKVLSLDIQIDHEDSNGLNNDPSNLRLATSEQNCHNSRKAKNNLSGHKGVYWHAVYKAWIGQVRLSGILHRTDPCPTVEVAVKLLRELREKLHKEFTRHG